jgi:two-component system response regulator HydG
MKKILIVDDDISFTLTLKAFLERNGFETHEVYNATKAIDLIKNRPFDVFLTDFRLPDTDGIELLKQIKKISPSSLVILMTAYADIRMAVNAIKFGAYEYVSKPVNPEELLEHIKMGLRKIAGESAKENSNKNKLPPKQFVDFIESQSPASKRIHEHVQLVAGTDLSVIIQGESGTGKEFIARRIHELSKRSDKPFVAVDCGALSQELAGSEFFGHIKGSFTGAINDKTGQFEAAHKGTLFLDEIGNLSYDIQIKLLRAIQERVIRKIGSNRDVPVDVRILVATNDDLNNEAGKGNFREDLFHRLNEFSITAPPLRERKEDIPLFVQHFLQKANYELDKNIIDIPANLMEIFVNYSWPGNIREIKNIIKRLVLLAKGNQLEKASLPWEIIHQTIMGSKQPSKTNEDGEIPLKETTEKTEKETILATLQKTKYNKSKTAKLLNIDRRTLYNKLKLYNIPL